MLQVSKTAPDGVTPPDGTTTADGQALLAMARTRTELGAVTPGYTLDPAEVVARLNVALATEIVCMLRYRAHAFLARGIHSESVRSEFKVHAAEELGHADILAGRIVQLGGRPDFSPVGLSKGHSLYGAATDLRGMMTDDLVAERTAIEAYRALILFVGDADPTTRRLLEGILAKEEEHADDLAGLLSSVHEP
jgi:bacterioferritin